MFGTKNSQQPRVILHCDLNNFFASVACKDDPNLRGKAVAVCGNPKLRKGIVLAKSEPAKARGVKTGMAIWEAKQLCPDLIVVAPDYQSYESYSKKVQAIYYRFTNQVESFGIDECWLDVTHSQKMFGDGVSIARQILAAVKQELGLTISVGISFNKTYAKLASDIAKPDDFLEITAANYQQLIFPLPLESLLFVGKQTRKLLNKLNLKTIGDLANCEQKVLASFIGINADKLIAEARGEDRSEVTDYQHAEIPKSVGNGTTVPFDMTTKAQVDQVLYLLSEKVGYRMRQRGLAGYTVHLSVKGTDLQWVGAQTSIPTPTNTVPTIRDTASQLFDELWGQANGVMRPVRALRVVVAHLTRGGQAQIDWLVDGEQEKKNQTIAQVMDQVRGKYGSEQIMYGGTAQSYHGLGFNLDFYDCDDEAIKDLI